MLVIVGILIVLGCVFGGFVAHGGNLHVLWQPSELVIIGGAAVGSFVISSPKKVLKSTISNLKGLFTAKETAKGNYMDILTCLYQLLSKVRKDGLVAIEQDIEDPEKSALFRNFPVVTHDHHLLAFICDNLKVVASTSIEPHRLDALMELEMDTQHHHELVPANAVNKVGDALPGLGIVAAVLGVVLTMGHINEPPEVLGHNIGAALVGTFLGVLLCYGFVGPMATHIEHIVNERSVGAQIVRVVLVAFVNGSSPQIAVEFGRRVIPGDDRPSFMELEKHLRERGR
jgi:chemotaxis protein MotA